MAEQETEAAREAKILKVMEELGVGRDAACLYLTIEEGHALVDDRVSLSADQSLEEYPKTVGQPIAVPRGQTG